MDHLVLTRYARLGLRTVSGDQRTMMLDYFLIVAAVVIPLGFLFLKLQEAAMNSYLLQILSLALPIG